MSCKRVGMFTMLRLMGLRSVRPCDLSDTMTKCSQIAPYHCSKNLSWSNKRESTRVVKIKRSAISSGGLRSRAKVSSEWQDDPPQFMDSTQSVVSQKPRTNVKVTPTRAEHKLSPELHALRLEDLPERNPKTLRTYKEDKPSVKGKKDDLVFGLAPCLLALMQGRRKVSTLFVKEGEDQPRDALQRVCEEAIKRDVQIKRIPRKEMDRMTNGRVNQGVCLQASPLQYLREWAVKPQKVGPRNQIPLWLVLDGIQDPMNLGAILRSAYFLGVDRIASSLENSCPLTPVVSKASSGVMELVEIYGYDNLEDMIKVKKEQRWQVIGTVGIEENESEIQTVKCSDFQMSKPTLLLMGGEGPGLSLQLRALCDVFLTIPPRRDLHPGVESLNVSVATGILLHSLLTPRSRGRR